MFKTLLADIAVMARDRALSASYGTLPAATTRLVKMSAGVTRARIRLQIVREEQKEGISSHMWPIDFFAQMVWVVDGAVNGFNNQY